MMRLLSRKAHYKIRDPGAKESFRILDPHTYVQYMYIEKCNATEKYLLLYDRSFLYPIIISTRRIKDFSLPS